MGAERRRLSHGLRPGRGLLACLLLAALPGFGSAQSRAAQSARPNPVEMEFRDEELAEIARHVAEATGDNLLFDDKLRGRVTIALQEPVDPDEARALLRSALLLGGFALVPTPGGAHKILPLQSATGSTPWLSGVPDETSDRLVVTLLRLRSANAPELVNVIQPRIATTGLVQAYRPTNALLLATTEAQLASLVELIRVLDDSAGTDLAVIPLRHADAETAASQVQAVFGEDSGALTPVRVRADERTRALIVEAAPTELRAVRRFVESIDLPPRRRGGLHVLRVLNADAELVAAELTSLQGESRGPLSGHSYDVVADAATNSLIVRSDPETVAVLASVLRDIDRIPDRVAIDVHLMEIVSNRSLAFGIDAIIPFILPDQPGDPVGVAIIGNATKFASAPSSEPLVARITGDPLLIPIVAPGAGPINVLVPEGALEITANEGQVVLSTLLSPSLIASVGEDQRIFSGENVPIPVSTLAQAGGVVNELDVVQNIERQDVGIDLRVRPIQVSEQAITLELDITATSVVETPPQPALGFQEPSQVGPVLRNFSLQSKVILVDGAVGIVAVSPDESYSYRVDGVPFLRSIPFFGWAFRNTVQVEQRSQIIVAVQATRVLSFAQLRARTIQRRLGIERAMARMPTLPGGPGEPFGLRVATRNTRADANVVARDAATLGHTLQIVEWKAGDEPRFDVYVIGFATMSDLSPASRALREKGFDPEVTVLRPGR